MALIYRAIWRDRHDDLIEWGAQQALRWLNDTKQVPLESLPTSLRGHVTYRRTVGEQLESDFELTTRRVESNDTTALQMRLYEHRPTLGQHWTVILTVLQTKGAAEGVHWVDYERLSEDPFERVPFQAPRLVKNMIEAGTSPHVDRIRLDPGPRPIDGDKLLELVRDPTRRLPLVVFSFDEAGDETTMKRAEAAYEHLAGVAQTYVLSAAESNVFNEAMGKDLGVWGGAARLYLPFTGTRASQPDRHRYVPGFRMSRSVEAAAEIFTELLSSTVPATPPPAEHESVRLALSGLFGLDDDVQSLLEHADTELRTHELEIQRLREELQHRDESEIDMKAEIEELEAEVNRLTDALARRPARDESPRSSGADLPAEVRTISEALAWAAHLPGIVIHESAPRDIDRLEKALSARAWANSIWRALRALDAYVANSDGTPGGFWVWCQSTASSWTWPTTPKKLSMRESDTVMRSAKLRQLRRLPVSKAVDPSGTAEMTAHIKIAEGGSGLAPRIYFLDDSDGSTGKMHVGFIGPHEYMPNASTN